jgi:hypothetical protein
MYQKVLFVIFFNILIYINILDFKKYVNLFFRGRGDMVSAHLYFDGSNTVVTCKLSGRAVNKRLRTEKDIYFDELYNEYYKVGMKNNVFIRKCYPLFAERFGFSDGNFDFFSRKVKNKYCYYLQRKKLFINKVLMNRWHYFFTITYNSKIFQSEVDFVKSLCRYLSNKCERCGWRQQGVFERGGKNDRLHYHGLLFLPEGEFERFRNRLIKREDYSVRKKKVCMTHYLAEIERKFGRCDFERLNNVLVEQGDVLAYIYKYMGKGDNKVFYSRYISSSLDVEVNLEPDVYFNADGELVCPDFSSRYDCLFCSKYVLFKYVFVQTAENQFRRFNSLRFSTVSVFSDLPF